MLSTLLDIPGQKWREIAASDPGLNQVKIFIGYLVLVGAMVLHGYLGVVDVPREFVLAVLSTILLATIYDWLRARLEDFGVSTLGRHVVVVLLGLAIIPLSLYVDSLTRRVAIFIIWLYHFTWVLYKQLVANGQHSWVSIVLFLLNALVLLFFAAVVVAVYVQDVLLPLL